MKPVWNLILIGIIKREMSRTYGKYVSYFYYFHNFSFFGGLSYCLFTSPFFCLRRHLELLKFLEIHGQKRFPVFLKSQFSSTKFLSLFTPVYPPPTYEVGNCPDLFFSMVSSASFSPAATCPSNTFCTVLGPKPAIRTANIRWISIQ